MLNDRERIVAAIAAISPNAKVLAYMEVEGNPPSKARPRFSGGGKAYSSDKQRKAERDLAKAMRQHVDAPLDGNLAVGCLFYRDTRQRIDVDNMLKHVMDSANGVCWHDDAQVTAQFGALDLDNARPRTCMLIATHSTSMVRVMNTTRVCEGCGGEFAPSFHTRKYCSRACASRRDRPDLSVRIPCDWCGVEFKRRTYTNRYCSHQCRLDGLHKPMKDSARVATCADCGNELANKYATRCRPCWLRYQADRRKK